MKSAWKKAIDISVPWIMLRTAGIIVYNSPHVIQIVLGSNTRDRTSSKQSLVNQKDQEISKLHVDINRLISIHYNVL